MTRTCLASLTFCAALISAAGATSAQSLEATSSDTSGATINPNILAFAAQQIESNTLRSPQRALSSAIGLLSSTMGDIPEATSSTSTTQ
ncbi:hypothetical protein [Tropicimonas marinistellae]|uniref:hypothetical protein n=1 Tax=Tropicimonas marinistellae TaxID=1739787 RepID=UPI00082F3FDA|nr:hypothetical protein [Tropicimonas marinistellae]